MPQSQRLRYSEEEGLESPDLSLVEESICGGFYKEHLAAVSMF